LSGIAIIASLVAVFLTPEGILVGSDTATRSNSAFSTKTKIVRCGPQIVVGLTGRIGWTLNGGVSVDSLLVITDACRELAKDPERPFLEQARRVARSLADSANKFFPQAQETPDRDGTLQRLIVTGYSGGRPAVVATQISRPPGSKLFDFHEFRDLSSGCVNAIGETGPGLALTEGRASIPERLMKLPEVDVVRAARPPCSLLTVEQAKAFFRLAVDVSYEYAAEFGIERGIINWPIEFTIIRPPQSEPIRREEKQKSK
jgi:hypothetical protein